MLFDLKFETRDRCDVLDEALRRSALLSTSRVIIASATQGVPPGKDELKWVANTTTLIYGEQDALLVDTFLSDPQTAELADWIATTGRRLSAIYITHGHPDHFFGLKLLRDRFPSARAVALPQVVAGMHRALAPDSVEEW